MRGRTAIFLFLFFLLSPNFLWASIEDPFKISSPKEEISDPVQLVALSAIKTYRILISPQNLSRCAFMPSCSAFGLEAVSRYGPIQGSLMAFDRISRCHPWAFGHYPFDPSSGLLLDPPEDHLLWDKPRDDWFSGFIGEAIGNSDQGRRAMEPGVLSFADYLFSLREYKAAASEYLRFAFTNPGHLLRPYAIFRAGICYEMLGMWDIASRTYREAAKDLQDDRIAELIEFALARCAFASRNLEEAELSLSSLIRSSKVEEIKGRSVLLLAACSIIKGDWEEGRRVLRDGMSAGLSQEYIEVARSVLETIEKVRMLDKRKSELIAGVLSAILPGAGKAYVGRTADAISSFISVAMTAILASFSQISGHEGTATILGILTAAFYLGNIYGSSVEARNYNKKKDIEAKNMVLSYIRQAMALEDLVDRFLKPQDHMDGSDKGSPGEILPLANSFFNSGHLEEAALEYRRSLFSSKDHDPELRDQVLYKIFECYLRIGMEGKAKEYLDEILLTSLDKGTKTKAHSSFVGFLIFSKRFLDAEIELLDMEVSPQSLYLSGWLGIMQHRWDDAEMFFRKLINDYPESQEAREAKEILKEIRGTKGIVKKSPTVAAFLSLIPGMGFVYSGKYGAGLGSALMNISYLLGIVRDIRHRSYLSAGVMGILWLNIYIGGIRGSMMWAEAWNEDMEERFSSSLAKRWGFIGGEGRAF